MKIKNLGSLCFGILLLNIVVFSVFCSENSNSDPGTDISDPNLTFERSSQSFTPMSTHDLCLGDVDSDGDMDVVLSNMGTNYSKVLLNNGLGNFTDSGQNLTQWGHGAGTGDFDNDGDPDIFITCASHNHNSKIYLNEGNGMYHDTGQNVGDLNRSGTGIHIIDIDSDGDLDCYINYYESQNRIFMNDGNGHFSESNFRIPDENLAFWADLDSDGDVDIFIKELGWGYITMINNGHGGFSEFWQYSDPDILYGDVALGDIDNDGDVDAVVSNGDDSASGLTKIFLNNGNGSFTRSENTIEETVWSHLALGDLDLDGDMDVFITNFGRTNKVFLNDGTGYFSDSQINFGGNTNSTWCVLGDLDSDGDLDVFIATFVDGPNEIWFNEIL
jgi:hypothetical protein